MNIDPIIVAVREAAIICREVQHNSLRSINKINKELNDSEPVTIADYASQTLIGRALSIHFKDDAVLSEEAGAQFLELTTDKQKAEIINLLTTILDVNVIQSQIVAWLDQGSDKSSAERTWIVDPIDGTKGFVAMRHYAIGVGIVENGHPTGAIIAAPGYGDGVSGDDDEGLLFYIKDGIPYQEALQGGGDATQISVNDKSESLTAVQSFEKQHASKSRMAIVREKAGMADIVVHELDSMEKYALVANGDAEVYLRLPNLSSTRPHFTWDHAPGVALVLAAGGMATDVTGEPLDFSQGRTLPNRGMVISNGIVHDRLLTAVNELLAEESQS